MSFGDPHMLYTYFFIHVQTRMYSMIVKDGDFQCKDKYNNSIPILIIVFT